MGVRDYAPHYEGSPIVIGGSPSGPSAVGVHEMSAAPGRHLPPNEADNTVFDRLGDGFTLLVRDVDHLEGDGRVEKTRIPIDVVSIGSAMDQYQKDMVLVRPDGFVGWVGDSSPPGEVFDRLAGY